MSTAVAYALVALAVYYAAAALIFHGIPALAMYLRKIWSNR